MFEQLIPANDGDNQGFCLKPWLVAISLDLSSVHTSMIYRFKWLSSGYIMRLYSKFIIFRSMSILASYILIKQKWNPTVFLSKLQLQTLKPYWLYCEIVFLAYAEGRKLLSSSNVLGTQNLELRTLSRHQEGVQTLFFNEIFQIYSWGNLMTWSTLSVKLVVWQPIIKVNNNITYCIYLYI